MNNLYSHKCSWRWLIWICFFYQTGFHHVVQGKTYKKLPEFCKTLAKIDCNMKIFEKNPHCARIQFALFVWKISFLNSKFRRECQKLGREMYREKTEFRLSIVHGILTNPKKQVFLWNNIIKYSQKQVTRKRSRTLDIILKYRHRKTGTLAKNLDINPTNNSNHVSSE